MGKKDLKDKIGTIVFASVFITLLFSLMLLFVITGF